jgi:arsenical pump membrane protein
MGTILPARQPRYRRLSEADARVAGRSSGGHHGCHDDRAGTAGCQPARRNRRAARLSAVAAEALGAVLLAAVLVAAIVRPWGLPEAAVAVPAAAVVVLTGALPAPQARSTAARLWPVLVFLAAVLVIGAMCQAAGVFAAAGARLAAFSRARPVRLLAGVFGLAAATTAVLSLDTTVILLTPVVADTASRLRVRSRPHLYACAHLANSASLLLPVSNLTNLLAFAISGLTLIRFTSLMVLPWLAVIAVEYAGFRLFFAEDLGVPAGEPPTLPPAAPVPRTPLVVVATTLAGFVIASFAGVSPTWPAVAGAVVLAGTELIRHRATPAEVLRAAAVPFLLFVLGLGLVVRAVVGHGLGSVIGELLPTGSSLAVLLGIAGIAAVLANLVNNLPAVLVLSAVLASRGVPVPPGPLLAALIGVNVGPNLTYAGSLATLLWRRLLHSRQEDSDLGRFTRLGLLTTPAALAAAVIALWLALTA